MGHRRTERNDRDRNCGVMQYQTWPPRLSKGSKSNQKESIQYPFTDSHTHIQMHPRMHITIHINTCACGTYHPSCYAVFIQIWQKIFPWQQQAEGVQTCAGCSLEGVCFLTLDSNYSLSYSLLQHILFSIGTVKMSAFYRNTRNPAWVSYWVIWQSNCNILHLNPLIVCNNAHLCLLTAPCSIIYALQVKMFLKFSAKSSKRENWLIHQKQCSKQNKEKKGRA